MYRCTSAIEEDVRKPTATSVLLLAGAATFIPRGINAAANSDVMGGRSPSRELIDGARLSFGNKRVARLVITLALIFAVIMPLDFLLPATTGVCKASLGVYFASYALGGVIGGAVVAGISTRRAGRALPFIVGATAAGFIVLSIGGTSQVVWAALLVLGIMREMIWGRCRSEMQLNSAPADGQLMFRFLTMTNYIVPAVGGVIIGLEIDSIGGGVTAALSIIPVLLAACVLVLTRTSSSRADLEPSLPSPRAVRTGRLQPTLECAISRSVDLGTKI